MTAIRGLEVGLLFTLFALTVRAEPAPQGVVLTPAIVIAGSPELIRLEAPKAAQVEGDWLGHKVEFFHDPVRGWFALAGVDVEAPTGPSTLTIHERLPGSVHNLIETVQVRPAHYRTAALTVAPEFVEPSPAEAKRIEAEIQLKNRIFSESAPRPLWSGDFRAPVSSAPTDSFGTQRTFNGKLASVHRGMDFRAPMQTPIRASNSGVVVLAQGLYFEGNCVVIDHGLGLYTIVMHLSRIDVHEGEHVSKGQLLGLSGATGRVTGPHLHWAVRWENAYLDPAKLMRMNLTRLP